MPMLYDRDLGRARLIFLIIQIALGLSIVPRILVGDWLDVIAHLFMLPGLVFMRLQTRTIQQMRNMIAEWRMEAQMLTKD